MKTLVKKSEAVQIKNAKESFVKVYDFERKELGIVVSKINSNYPDKGFVINKECDEIYYVLSGEAKVYFKDENEEKVFEIKEGDALFLEKNKAFRVETNNLEIIAPTAPKWFEEQYKNVD